MSEDFSAAEPLLAEYADIEAEMAGPAAADPGAMRRLGRRYAELGRVVAAYRAWQSASADLADARELAAEVWMRPWDSVTGTRWTRWTPPSYFRCAHTPSWGSTGPRVLMASRTSL